MIEINQDNFLNLIHDALDDEYAQEIAAFSAWREQEAMFESVALEQESNLQN